MDLTMDIKHIDTAVVSLIRNRQSKNDYYIRLDNTADKALYHIERLRNQFDYDVELGPQIIITKESDSEFYHPAKHEAEKFMDYLKNVVATNYKEQNFLGGWFEFNDINNKDTWLKDYYAYQDGAQKVSLAPKTAGEQISLF